MHLLGYKDGDNQNEKYFWPDSGAHFDYYEVIKKLQKIIKKKRKNISQNAKGRLSKREELMNNSKETDLKLKDMMNNGICKPFI